MEERKYELTDETKMIDGHILHRIRALKSLPYVQNGDLGVISRVKIICHKKEIAGFIMMLLCMRELKFGEMLKSMMMQ